MPIVNSNVVLAKVSAAHPDWGRERLAKATGLGEKTVRTFLRNRHTSEPAPAEKAPRLTHTEKGCEAEAVGDNVRTLDDLLAVCKVDLTVWEVERFVTNKWEVAMKMKARVNSKEFDRAEHRPLYQIKAWLRRKQPVLDAETAAEAFSQHLARSMKPLRVPLPPKSNSSILYEISIPDLHLGKLAWSKETGHEDWDSRIAAQTYRAALDGLLACAPSHIGRILLPIGNDFFNVDGDLKQTTAGTPQDEDTRWQRSFKEGCALALEAITRLAKIAPVDVVMVAGNHDYQRVFYLGVFLEASFARCGHVTVRNEPTARKYYSWGKTLIGFTHGDKEKQEELPLIMAAERPDLWSASSTREWHLGHEHKEKVRSKCGVVTRVIPSLCPPESWHASRGYVGGLRQAVSFVYDDHGLIGQHYHTVRDN